MNIKNLFTDDDAVSPVIGVILMVAITVILAAVIGAFVLDLGGSQEKTPQASFDWDQNSTDAVTVTLESGESIGADRLSTNFDGGSFNSDGDWATKYSGSEVGAGDYVVVTGLSSGDEVRVVWTSESGETSSTLSTYTLQ
ncbi:type IV pilin [Halostella sp. JP-L12]|uniref:type IV pilin n=1 Tax=Halostella TaxID=1843185 RepID=UPI000EF8109B|nr:MULTISPECIES: type IV pilin N-terminal domain-containing protein [Halostella]NHN46962.1 type IV pilin [Halostella sp. JP-L12]